MEKGCISLTSAEETVWKVRDSQLAILVPKRPFRIETITEGCAYRLLTVRESLYALELFRLKLYYQHYCTGSRYAKFPKSIVQS